MWDDMIVKIDCTSIYCKILRYGVGKRLKMFTFIHVEKIIIFAQKFQMSLENANKYARSRPKRLRFILPSIKLPPPETFENLPFRLKLIYNHVHLSPSPGIYTVLYSTVYIPVAMFSVFFRLQVFFTNLEPDQP